MTDHVQPDITACARAWQTLRMAHDRVAERLTAELEGECNLALNEFDVLLYLRTRARDEVRLNLLLDAVTLSQPALSRLVARLEERGLIARSKNDEDGRAVVVHLTPSGETLTNCAIEVHARVVHETLTSKFTEGEQAALLKTLSRVGK
jgi:DNA-binding MarR family transcriptional regulator